MKAILNVSIVLVLALLSHQGHAQTLITLKAFANPGYFSSPLSVYALEAKTASPFSCFGTTTSSIVFATENNQYGNSATNINFVVMSELINAAKSGYVIELVAGSYFSSINTCYASKYFIHVL